MDTSDEWITTRTGIKERRIGGSTAGLSAEAGRQALEMAGLTPDRIDAPSPGTDDALRAIQLSAEGIADAVLDGKASIPEVPTGDDEFVELDESGKPKVEAKPQRKPAPKKRARVTKVRSKGRARPGDDAPSEGGDEEPEGE